MGCYPVDMCHVPFFKIIFFFFTKIIFGVIHQVWLGVIIFGSVRFLSKKVTKPKFFFFEKKNRNRVKPTGFGSVRFVFLVQKPVQTGLARFFRFGSVFPVWLCFFPVFCRFRFGSVRFFRFFVYKTEPNRPVFSKK